MMALREIRCLAAVVDAAGRAGLLARLAADALTVGELAEDLALDPAATACLLEVLVAWQVVVRNGDRHALAEPVRRELEGPSARPLSEGALDFLQSGSASALSLRARGEYYASRVERLSRWFEPAARSLAEQLAPLLSSEPAPRILDAGAGAGIWSLAVLQRNQRACSVALDLAPVLPAYAAAARKLGLLERVQFLCGDYLRIDLPANAFHLVIAASILHLETPDAACALVQRLSSALAPGGALIVVDMLSDGSARDERSRALYAFDLALRVGAGFVHREQAIRGWLEAAGLAKTVRAELSHEIRGLRALIARRS